MFGSALLLFDRVHYEVAVVSERKLSAFSFYGKKAGTAVDEIPDLLELTLTQKETGREHDHASASSHVTVVQQERRRIGRELLNTDKRLDIAWATVARKSAHHVPGRTVPVKSVCHVGPLGSCLGNQDRLQFGVVIELDKTQRYVSHPRRGACHALPQIERPAVLLRHGWGRVAQTAREFLWTHTHGGDWMGVTSLVQQDRPKQKQQGHWLD